MPKQLVDPDAPIEQLEDGSEVVDLGAVFGSQDDASPTPVIYQKRTLEDLPNEIKQCNLMVLICAYRIYGIDDKEIALALNIDMPTFNSVCGWSGFNELDEAIKNNIRSETDNAIQRIFQDNSLKAASAITEQLVSPNVRHRFKAAELTLANSGFAPMNGANQKKESGLNIVIKVDSPDAKVPELLLGD